MEAAEKGWQALANNGKMFDLDEKLALQIIK
jgi:hypothetical protein